MAILRSVETPDWVWFETGLAYDNARLSQALIVTGMATGDLDQVEAGLHTLRWLMNVQTAPAGFFRPVGSDTFGTHRVPPAAFDQQPLEAAAAISACLAAGAPTAHPNGEQMRRALLPGSLAATIFRRRLWTSRPEVVVMGSIGIARTRIAVASPLSPICLASPRCDRWRA